eukprot:SAG11_NODE_7019_length_1207_cov_1.312274_1_plen_192_part_00
MPWDSPNLAAPVAFQVFECQTHVDHQVLQHLSTHQGLHHLSAGFDVGACICISRESPHRAVPASFSGVRVPFVPNTRCCSTHQPTASTPPSPPPVCMFSHASVSAALGVACDRASCSLVAVDQIWSVTGLPPGGLIKWVQKLEKYRGTIEGFFLWERKLVGPTCTKFSTHCGGKLWILVLVEVNMVCTWLY